jgi:transposase
MAKRSKKRCENLPILHPHAAGIDVGASELFVAVSADRDPQPVRSFPTITRNLNALADWLQQCGIRSVAMESTSVYWIPVYQILESRGLEVCLVNVQHVKNVPGRKTDVSDCQWLQYLHSVGLLRASFRPPGFICAIRSLWRHRSSLIQMAAEHVLHMQKALDQMNLQIHRGLNDITGLSGLRILDAILAGERDPLTLARLCHGGVKSSEHMIAKSLEGDYRPEHLFALRQSLAAFHCYQQRVVEVDQEIQCRLGSLETATTAEPTVPKRTKASAYQRRRYEPKTFDLRVGCIESSESISPTCLASARLQPRPSCVRSARMCPDFALCPPLHPGWDSVLRTRSVVARCSIPRVAASGAGCHRATHGGQLAASCKRLSR